MSPHNTLTETWEIPSKRVFRQIIFPPRRFLGLRQLWKFPFLTCGTSVLYCFCSLHTCMFSWWNGLLIYGSTPYAFHCYVLLLFMNPYSTQPSWKSWSTLSLAEDSNTIFHGIWFPFLLRVFRFLPFFAFLTSPPTSTSCKSSVVITNINIINKRGRLA